MRSWSYELGDVLIVEYKGVEQPVRVAGYVDSLDDRTPLYVNLRISGGLRWGERKVKINPKQIICEDKEWYQRQHDKWETSIKETTDIIYAKMTPSEKKRLKEHANKRRKRTSLDIMIDRACGLE